MTDPNQWTKPPQQGSQQWYTDDILGWEDIFAKIPEAMPEEEDIPYGDMLEKKYQFNHLDQCERVLICAFFDRTQPQSQTFLFVVSQ